jgi:methyl-accepting chemotaxis protein
MTESVLRPLGSSRSVPLGFQVAAGVGLLVALVALSVAIAVLLVLGLRDDQAELSGHSVPYANAVASAALNAKAIANHERGYLISGDPQFLEEIDQGLLDVRAAFAKASISAKDDAQHAAAAEAHAGFERWVWAMQRQLQKYRSGQRKEATAAALGPGRALRKDYERSLDEAEGVAATAIQLQRHSYASSGWITSLLVLLVFVLVVGVAVTLWLLRALDRANDPPEAEPVGAPIAVFPSPGRRLGGPS